MRHVIVDSLLLELDASLQLDFTLLDSVEFNGHFCDVDHFNGVFFCHMALNEPLHVDVTEPRLLVLEELLVSKALKLLGLISQGH